MTTLPTPDQRRRSLLLLRHVERALVEVLTVNNDNETRERLKRVRERIAELRN